MEQFEPAPRTERTHDIPAWFMLLVLPLVAGGGGWLLWRTLQSPGKQVADVPADRINTLAPIAPAKKVKPPVTPLGLNAARAPGAMPDGIRPASGRNDAWIAHGGAVTLLVSLTPEGNVDLSPAYVIAPLTADEADVLMMRRLVNTNRAVREQLKPTAEQVERLRTTAAFRGMDYDSNDRNRLIRLFRAWRVATTAEARQSAQTALLAALTEIAAKAPLPKSGYDPKLVERAKAVFTVEQVAAYRQAVSAATRPTP